MMDSIQAGLDNWTKQIIQAIHDLDRLPSKDPEIAHLKADEILLSLVSSDVAAAYQAVAKSCDWWGYR
jgi:hypothetical protein